MNKGKKRFRKKGERILKKCKFQLIAINDEMQFRRSMGTDSEGKGNSSVLKA